MVLDGSKDAHRRLVDMLKWDVLNGVITNVFESKIQVSRRAWAKNENAEETIKRAMEEDPKLRVTLPNHSDLSVLEKSLQQFKL